MDLTSPINYPYDSVRLTNEVELIPNEWGLINQLGVFETDRVATTMVEIGMSEGVITVLGAEERGNPGPVGAADDEKSVIVKIPHFPYDEIIKAGDLQDKFVFGSGRQQMRSVDTETQKRLVRIRRRQALTLEFLRMGALKGLILDGRGKTLYNLHTVFGVAKKTVDFKLGTAATDVRDKCEEVYAHIEDNLLGETMTGVEAMVSQEFFAKLVSHPNVEKYYLNYALAQGIAADRLETFQHGGILFRKYRATVTGVDKVSRRLIAADYGHARPTGTMESFKTVFGPPDHVNFANTEGPDIFVSPKVLDHGKGVELHSESNVLPYCARPAMLVELLTSD
ncbi:MAG: major capsid protein [Alphaproteobacteria bacterium]|nr:major capsid protein [Alphaproteobacteria bacterium]